ncbi:MAG TPA: hypothetical protein VGP25_00460 [Gemmatimonadaceae bacterium]|jgi:hypothetical protein|nr:hypothetical protein [Gemmatimonadaceae bacterium]
MRRLLATLAFTTFAACSSIGGDLGPRIDGNWSGSSNGQAVTMQLIQSGSVGGIATFSGSGGARSYSVAGIFDNPTFTATLSGSAPGDTITLNATVTGKSMVGTLVGAGFTGNGLAMSRQ